MTLDADGQHDPAEIKRFLEAFEAGRPELIVGRRDSGSMPPVRRVSNTLGGWLFSIALGLPMAEVPIRTIYGGEPSHIRPWTHFTSFLRVSLAVRQIVRGG